MNAQVALARASLEKTREEVRILSELSRAADGVVSEGEQALSVMKMSRRTIERWTKEAGPVASEIENLEQDIDRLEDQARRLEMYVDNLCKRLVQSRRL